MAHLSRPVRIVAARWWVGSYNPEDIQTEGLKPNNMCILKGFPTALKSKSAFPFGIWFANANTLYVADEDNGETTYSTTKNEYTEAAASTTAGCRSGSSTPHRDRGSWPTPCRRA